jgi:hypothetical protein
MFWDTPICAPMRPTQIKAIESHKYKPAVPAAATEPLPKRPSQNMSVKLNAIWKKDVAIMGRDIVISLCKMGPWVRSKFLVCVFKGYSLYIGGRPSEQLCRDKPSLQI